MKVAVVSEDFRSVSGQVSKARRFLVFETEQGKRPMLVEYCELHPDWPTYNDLPHDDKSFHPLDGMVLIAGEAGAGFCERLARRGSPVYLTSEKDPHTAVARLLEDRPPADEPVAQDTSAFG